MTEQEILYSLLEVIRNSEITEDDKTTEAFLRNLIHMYRADAIKDELTIADELYQTVEIPFLAKSKEKGFYESTRLPDILFNTNRGGIIVNDEYGRELPVVPKEEALLSQKSRFYQPLYIAYVQSNKLVIIANVKKLLTENPINRALIKTLEGVNPKIEINCILTNPNDSPSYDWRSTPFPFPGNKIAEMKQKILRREFGIMSEVKRDEIQNARADNIIYQDESKLYK